MSKIIAVGLRFTPPNLQFTTIAVGLRFTPPNLQFTQFPKSTQKKWGIAAEKGAIALAKISCGRSFWKLKKVPIATEKLIALSR